jgi:hypothetical protein
MSAAEGSNSTIGRQAEILAAKRMIERSMEALRSRSSIAFASGDHHGLCSSSLAEKEIFDQRGRAEQEHDNN